MPDNDVFQLVAQNGEKTGLLGAFVVSALATFAYARRFLSRERVGREADNAQVSVFQMLQTALAEEIRKRQLCEKDRDALSERYNTQVGEIAKLQSVVEVLQAHTKQQAVKLIEREAAIIELNRRLENLKRELRGLKTNGVVPHSTTIPTPTAAITPDDSIVSEEDRRIVKPRRGSGRQRSEEST